MNKKEEKPVEKKEETNMRKQKKDLKTYSEGVQKRIAKLTRKMREAERQKEEALFICSKCKTRKR